jgi:fumarate hydratase, class I
MTVIRQEDFIRTVAGALQYISYYHPTDYITSPTKAYEREQSHAAKDAMAQILINSRMCAEGHRPICQDTGIVNVFVKVGMDVRFEAAPGGDLMDLQQMCDEGVRRAYLDPDNKLRASLLADPAGARKNTKDNTPAAVNVELVKGDKVDITVAAKGGGSEAKSKFVMLNPSDSVVEWVLKTVPTMGAGWCPISIRLRSTSGPSSPTTSHAQSASTSTPLPAPKPPPGNPAKSCCSTANSSPAATPPTNA